ncbi:response regulator [Winogradskyella flava]|uniref:histidine kinase n=1 Tax=Winogradskyella flava TaxID=1884876 RepID=A0A842ISF1_9FLAO|nr:response regulator [Winogradskyella flava]MBC2844357.1 response regulator [Winogradskyella flava]
MKLLTKTLVVLASLFNLYAFCQEESVDFDSDASPLSVIQEVLPKISTDSTSTEITSHVEAMLDWMTQEHYKSNYAPILIYAEKGLALARKSNNKQHIHDARSVIGNTLIRIKDTVSAKKLFLKSLREAQDTNDSSIILKSKGNLANIYYYTEGYKNRTVKIYLECVEIAKRLKDTTRLFILHHNLSRAFNETKNPERSAYHVKETEKYLNLIGNPPHYKASHLHNKGRMLLLLDKPNEAIKNFQETIDICENTEFTEALIEGYTGYKEALEMKKDYQGIFEISKKLEFYQKKKDEDEAKSIIESVSAKLNVERFKDQIKSKELEKKLLVEQAERKNILLLLIAGIVVFLMVILAILYHAYKRRKLLVSDLRVKNKQYLKAKEESDQLTQAKAKFFATVSHELRTPLYGVIGLSSILMENKDLKKHEKDLKSLKFSANYLLALINDLLQFNKIENDSFTKEEAPFDLREQISTIISSFEYIRLQHNNNIDVNISDKLPRLLKGNSVRLSQILMNLIGNACKFTEDGDINVFVNVIELHDNDVKLEFIIQDTGHGIEKSKLKNIFDEFTQLDALTNTYQGTGLGLSIVSKLLEQAGSSISVESELGEGSTFKFILSLDVVSLNENEHIETSFSNTNQLAKKYILVVEDNRINQTVTRKILENSQVKCEIAQNGQEAVDMVKANDYDLVLMDINMPVKNGIEATKEIREFNEVLPIIALTAVEIEEQKHRIFQSGMNDIIVKPYDIDLFKKIIVKNLTNTVVNDFRKLA